MTDAPLAPNVCLWKEKKGTTQTSKMTSQADIPSSGAIKMTDLVDG
jgi:hypothetical protein